MSANVLLNLKAEFVMMQTSFALLLPVVNTNRYRKLIESQSILRHICGNHTPQCYMRKYKSCETCIHDFEPICMVISVT